MATNNKSRGTNSRYLAAYLAGEAALKPALSSMTELNEALAKLLDRRDIEEDEIVARVRKILRSRETRFDNVNVIQRALKVRADGEVLFSSLKRVQQVRLLRKR